MSTHRDNLQKRDLGLSYEDAMHGVQTATKWRINSEPPADAESTSFAGPKHLRVGVDMRASDAMGLALLLIDKGLITDAEYREYMRLAANAELAMHEERAGVLMGTDRVSFR